MADTHIDTLADGILTLDEPWRGRFLALLAQRAHEKGQAGHPQSREHIAQWLHDADIYHEFIALLDEWRGIGAK